MKKFLLSFSSIFEFLTLKEKEKCIFFYSESKYYRDHFIDLIEQCIKKNKLKKIKLIITMYLGGTPYNVEKFYKLKACDKDGYIRHQW